MGWGEWHKRPCSGLWPVGFLGVRKRWQLPDSQEWQAEDREGHQRKYANGGPFYHCPDINYIRQWKELVWFFRPEHTSGKWRLVFFRPAELLHRWAKGHMLSGIRHWSMSPDAYYTTKNFLYQHSFILSANIFSVSALCRAWYPTLGVQWGRRPSSSLKEFTVQWKEKVNENIQAVPFV